MQIQRRPFDLTQAAFGVDIEPLLQRIYLARGVTRDAQLPQNLADLLAPRLKGMDAAVAVLADSIEQKRRLLVVGDFDADGATSSALAVLALRALGAEQVDFLVPNRFDFGYGLTPEIVEVAKSFSPDVIITVDNGISSIAGAQAARAAGIRLVVTDHHLPADELPIADAIVNPNQRGCDFSSKNLAGVGVIFYVMMALRAELKQRNWFAVAGIDEPKMAQFLDLVALGTVADVVPLDANNRLMVKQGLQRIRAGVARPGILAILQIAGRNRQALQASDLGFAIGPRLNAAGRLDDMSLGIRCLLTDNFEQALDIAQQLDDFNRDRKSIEGAMQKEAEVALAAIEIDGEVPWGVSLYHPEWHQGVIGILASRIKDKLHRPVIMFADAGNGEMKGSGRSIAGLHLRDALDRVAVSHPGLIKKFGGHAMAAGLTLGQEQWPVFQRAFDDVCRVLLSEEQLQAIALTDGELTAAEMNLGMAEMLADAGPWGQHFPEPNFDGQFLLLQQRLVGAKHLKMQLALPADPTQCWDAIAFNVDLSQWPAPGVHQVRAVYKLNINEYRGQRSLQLMVDYLEALI